ncbi:thioesterase II family protein [Myceligenerans pegani]|uniref:Thioesterase n=1 Tax=Myceligenerans pegani TaxID=2776917 RepID=A0ABR9MYU5_9MICO|nr:alpha/beta fold hydrolase [Myceligenerans sp. TRM 65318]MBE1876186.1 thioesterase [Myceligenerans sp. TRM 65318]MBE3018457.1 thioesterase [Myceligenerans sp. TRM 65318]
MDSLWFRRFAPEAEGRLRLLCFPHAGGAASTYSTLSRALAPHLDVLSVQYPGRQDRRNEPLVAEIEDLAARIADRLPDGPYAFFGHSMGAVVAYEVARLLADTGPVRMFVSGRAAPSVPNSRFVHRMDDRGLISDVRFLRGMGSSVLDDPDVLAMVLPVLRADYTAIETYRWTPGPPLEVPVTVLVGDEDPLVDARQARAWEEHTTGELTLRPYPGGHFYLEDQPQRVARDLLDDLGVTVAGPSPQ